jgi:ribosomal-protein-alanine N-acetyltransferase
MKIFPEFDIGDYVLREKQDYDVVDFFNYYSDPLVNQHIISEIPANLEEARKELYWRNIFYQNDGIYFAIAKKENNQLIGSIGLTNFNRYNNRIEISYDLASQYWRKGISFAAIKQVLHYGFYHLNVNRIEAFTAIDNIASKKLLIKCGFQFEGILRQHRFYKGNYVDVDSFSILKSDFSHSGTLANQVF